MLTPVWVWTAFQSLPSDSPVSFRVYPKAHAQKSPPQPLGWGSNADLAIACLQIPGILGRKVEGSVIFLKYMGYISVWKSGIPIWKVPVYKLDQHSGQMFYLQMNVPHQNINLCVHVCALLCACAHICVQMPKTARRGRWIPWN